MHLFYFTAKFCPSPPQIDEGTTKILHSGLHFGPVCPGTFDFEAFPLNGCEVHNIQIGQTSRIERGPKMEVKYSVMLDKANGGDLLFLLVFSQPHENFSVTFPTELELVEKSNPTDMIVKLSLDSQSSTVLLDINLSYELTSPEPCILNGICQALDSDPLEVVQQKFLDFPLDFRNVTAFNSAIEYKCELAKEFEMPSGNTQPKINKTCQWDETWSPDEIIPDCVCK